MKLSTALEAYQYNSGKVSEVARQLALGGIAVIWIFKIDAGGAQRINPNLSLPSLFLVLCLTCDLLQYAVSAGVWSFFHRVKEKELARTSTDGIIPVDTEIGLAPKQLNWLPLSLFWSKTILVIVAYFMIIHFILTQ